MKQTQNALKFLISQYRSIFKQAYLKGLVTAAVLSSTMVVASTAGAAEVSGIVSGESTEAATGANSVQISDTQTVGEDGKKYFSKDITITENGHLTIHSGDAFYADGDINIKGKLTVNGTQFVAGTYSGSTNAIKHSMNMQGAGADKSVLTIGTDTGVNIKSGVFSNGKIVFTSGSTSNYSNLWAYGEGSTWEDGNGDSGNKAGTANLSFDNMTIEMSGSAAIGAYDSITLSNSKVNIGADSYITGKFVDISDSTITLDGNGKTIPGGEGEKNQNVALLTSRTGDSGNYLSLTNTKITVGNGKYGLIRSSDLRINSGSTITNEGQLGLGVAGGKITINGGTITKTNDLEANNHIFLLADTTMTSGKIELSGSHGLWGSTQFDSGNGASKFDTDFTATGGTITVSGSQIQTHNLTLGGNVEVTVGGGMEKIPETQNTWVNNAMIGGASTDSVVTIQDSAKLTLNDASQVFGNTINIQGGIIVFNGSGQTSPNTTDGSKAEQNSLSNNSSFLRAFGTNATINLDSGTLQIGKGKFGGLYGSAINLNGGTVEFSDAKSTLVFDRNLSGTTGSSQVTIKDTTFTNKGILRFGANAKVNFAGDTTFAGVIESAGTNAGDVTISGALNFQGDGNTATKVDFKTAGAVKLGADGTLTIADAANTIGLTVTEATAGDTTSYTFKLNADSNNNQFKGFNNDAAGSLHVDLSNVGLSSKEISSANSAAFKDALRKGLSFGSGGIIYADGVTFTLADDAIDENNSASWDDIQDAVNGGVQDNQLTNTEVKVDSGTEVFGGLGSVNLTQGNTVTVAGGETPLELNGYKDKAGELQNSGSLVVVGSGTTASVGGASLKAGSTLNINAENGIIGDIQAAAGTGTLTFAANTNTTVVQTGTSVSALGGTSVQKGDIGSSTDKIKQVNIQGNVKTAGFYAVEANVASNLESESFEVDQANVSGSVTTETADIKKANISGYMTAQTATVEEGVITGHMSGESIDFTKSGEVNGGSISGESVEAQNLIVKNDGVIKAQTFTLKDQNSVLQIGTETVSNSTASTASASFENFDLNGGTLILDPAFGQKTATLFTKNIGGVKGTEFDVNGMIVVGQNSALGLGGTEDEFLTALAKQQDGISLDKDGIGAYVYIARAGLDLTSGKLLIGKDSIDTLKTKLDSETGYNIYLGNGSGLQVSNVALDAAESNSSSVLTNVNGIKAASNGSTILVPANLQPEQLKYIFGSNVANGIKFEGSTGSGSITVTTENGLFTGVVNEIKDLYGSGDFVFSIADNARGILSSLSDPTFDYVTKALSSSKLYDKHSDFDKAEKDYAAAPDTAPKVYDENGFAIVREGSGYKFLGDAAGSSNSRAIEQAARLSTLGGSVQATYAVANTTSDAINGRMGMGNSQAKLTVADNTGTGLWVTPIYRTVESDSFDANGVSAGADVDLYGAALGADFTLANGIRLGAMFNVGSGDADGNNAGAGISNDFDYYGFGVYAAFTPVDNLTVGADVTYTVLDNDFSAESNVAQWGKMQGQADTNAFSVGVTAQYTHKAAIDVAPHIGLRFTQIDMDNYAVKADGQTIVESDSSNMNVISIPVGVSLAKDFNTQSGWNIRPAMDFTVTFNTGDKEFDESASFTGVMGSDIHYTTEVLDSVTYGAAAGVSTSNGDFSFGLNVGYTGSSNTDEYGVNANARFVF